MDTPPEVMGLNPFEPGYFDNPYGQYAALRDSMPIHQTTMGSWLLTRWDDVHALLRTPGMSVDERNVANSPTRAERIAEIRAAAGLAEQRRPSRAILNIDPPDHTRIRGLVAKAFTPRAIEQIRGQIQQLTDSLLDELADHGSEPTDLISGLAFPLPFAVINSMLGLPESADTNHLRELSHTITQVLDPLLLIENGPAVLAAAQEMEAILSDAIEWKRARDDDDLLMALIHAEEHGDKLSDAELLENVVLLFLAGHETTVNLIGNALNALLTHRNQLEILKADPTITVNAVEELLRWDSPVQFSRRIALEPATIKGVTFEPGDMVLTCLGAANRDPKKFGPTAGQLDLKRADAREHVSFGSGVHHCLGAALARMEGQEAIGRLVTRFPNIELGGEPIHNTRLVLRGFDQLPVVVAP